MLPLGTLLALSAGAGVLGLDSTGFPQVMVSRPLVVGGVFGFLLGYTAEGLMLGGLVEMLFMADVAVGSVVPPDPTIAAAVAAIVGVRLAHGGTGLGVAAAVAVGVLASVPAAYLGARAEVIQRRLANRLSRFAEAELDRGRLPSLGGILAAALILAWLRGALVCALCLGLGLPALEIALMRLPPQALLALRWSFWLFWLLGLAVAADHFWDRRGLKYAALALVVLAVFGTEYDSSQFGVLAAAVGGALAVGFWRWRRALRGEAA